MQYILWNLPYLACPDTSRRSVGPPVLERWGRSGHSETGARFDRGRSEGAAGHYLTGLESTIQEQSLCGDGGRMEERWGSRKRIWVQTSKQANKQTSKQVNKQTSPERLRGAAGMENWGPEETGNRSRPDHTSTCSPGGSPHHHQKMASPSPSLDTDSPLSRTIRIREWK